MNPLVSIKVVTYNHVNYIGKCLDSLVSQQTNFPFEVIVGEDYSTDGTREIVFNYQKKYPDLIKVVTSDQNVGVRENGIRVRKACSGKFYAICDGDDFWNDNLKLQKQIDFLESNPDYGMVYSDINVVDENDESYYAGNIDEVRNSYKSGFIFWDLWRSCFINTNTVVVRSSVFNQLSNDGANNPDKWYIYDYWYWLYIAKDHKIKYYNEKLATYRYHKDGISRNKSFYEIRPLLVKLDVVSSMNNQINTVQRKKQVGGLIYRILFKKSVNIKYKKEAFKLFFRTIK